jgi:hypothetical protein
MKAMEKKGIQGRRDEEEIKCEVWVKTLKPGVSSFTPLSK